MSVKKELVAKYINMPLAPEYKLVCQSAYIYMLCAVAIERLRYTCACTHVVLHAHACYVHVGACTYMHCMPHIL